MLQIKCRALLHEFVCDVVIFLFKTGESLLDASIRPYVIAAVCSDLYGGADRFSDGTSRNGDDLLSAGVSVNNSEEYGKNEHVCWHLNDLPDIESKVQSKAAGVLVAHRVLVNVPAVILGLFCGAWSDSKGRKFPMMAPSAGSCLGVTLYLASTQVRNYRVLLLLAGAAIQGMFGKSPVISMAVNSHVADTSDTEKRTQRLGRLLASSFLGMFLGSLLAGVLQDVSSLVTTLLVVSVCHALSVLTVLLGVPETRSEVKDGSGQAILGSDGLREKEEKEPGLFSWAGCRDSLMTVCRARDGNKRTVVIVSLLLITLNSCLKVGDQDVTVLFVQKPPLSWPESWYGYLTAVDYATMGVSLLLLLPLLADLLHTSDVAIVTVGVAFKLVRSVWAGFCTETWMVFLSVVAGSLGGLITPALRSVLSKIVNEGEVGKMFSILASLETLSKLLGSSVFTGVYAATVHSVSAAAYLLEAAVYLIVLGMTMWLGRMMREDGAHELLLTFSRPYYAFHKADKAAGWKGAEPEAVGAVPVIIRTEDTSRPEKSREGRLRSLGASTP